MGNYLNRWKPELEGALEPPADFDFSAPNPCTLIKFADNYALEVFIENKDVVLIDGSVRKPKDIFDHPILKKHETNHYSHAVVFYASPDWIFDLFKSFSKFSQHFAPGHTYSFYFVLPPESWMMPRAASNNVVAYKSCVFDYDKGELVFESHDGCSQFIC